MKNNKKIIDEDKKTNKEKFMCGRNAMDREPRYDREIFSGVTKRLLNITTKYTRQVYQIMH